MLTADQKFSWVFYTVIHVEIKVKLNISEDRRTLQGSVWEVVGTIGQSVAQNIEHFFRLKLN